LGIKRATSRLLLTAGPRVTMIPSGRLRLMWPIGNICCPGGED